MSPFQIERFEWAFILQPLTRLHKILIATVFLVVAKKKIEEIVTAWAVDPLFSSIKTNIAIDVIFLATIVAVIVTTLKKAKNFYIVSTSWIVSSCIVGIIYSYYRFHESLWAFERLNFIPKLAYFDLIYLLPFTVGVLLIATIFQKVNNPRGASRLLEDNAWEDGNIDLFNRQPAAKRIATLVTESSTSKSFAIGVCADWGDGKSSFIQMIKHEIPKNPSHIIIDFSPWFSQNPNQIISQFFELFQSKLSPYHLSLSRKLAHYSQSLSTLTGNFLMSTLSEANDLFNEKESIEEERESINKVLRKIDKKIIVFIDDVDRLDSEEVMEILRLIRNSANFYNLFFIVAFDREYVKSAISQVNSHNVDQYLEKIFQLELRPPAFDKAVIKQELFRLLFERFPSMEEEIKSAIYGSSNSIEELQAFFGNDITSDNLVDYFILNLRDVVRFVNLFTANFTHLANEVVFTEFFYVQLIHLKYPQIYYLLMKNEWRFFEVENITSNIIYSLKKMEVDKTEPKSL